MPKLIILGSSNAIPDEHHENTHMAVVTKKRLVLIDCANNPTVRLSKAGLDINALTDLIVTHFHPDHVSGVPSLLMNSWLLGRNKPLHIYGLSDTIERLKRMMDAYEWGKWPDFYPVEFHKLLTEEMTLVLKDQELLIYSSPVHHMIPTIGLRIEFLQTEQTVAYSCDTEPCAEVARLAEGADLLIHEATGEGFGHSSASQAGKIASQAKVKELYLIHYNAKDGDPNQLVIEAQGTFDGPVFLANDLMSLDF